MFEDEEVDVHCPKCGHLNAIEVHDFEERAETHFVCQSCKTPVKIEAGEFRGKLDAVKRELQELERAAGRGAKPPPKRRKGDFSI